MISHEGDRCWSPRPEELAAYADGELDHCETGAALKQRIEKWLAVHPEETAEIESIGRLAFLFKWSAAAEPGEPAWSQLSSRINKDLLEGSSQKPRRKTRKVFWAALLAVAAAAVLLALNFNLGPQPTHKRTLLKHEQVAVEPFPVATADEVEVLRVDGDDTNALVVGQLPVSGLLLLVFPQEVEILQVDGDDTDSLVVGELPVQGPLKLADPGDVTVKSVERDKDQMKPTVQMDPEAPPMVWAPLPTEGTK